MLTCTTGSLVELPASLANGCPCPRRGGTARPGGRSRATRGARTPARRRQQVQLPSHRSAPHERGDAHARQVHYACDGAPVVRSPSVSCWQRLSPNGGVPLPQRARRTRLKAAPGSADALATQASNVGAGGGPSVVAATRARSAGPRPRLAPRTVHGDASVRAAAAACRLAFRRTGASTSSDSGMLGAPGSARTATATAAPALTALPMARAASRSRKSLMARTAPDRPAGGAG